MNTKDKTSGKKPIEADTAKQSTKDALKALKLRLKKSEARADKAEARLAKLSKPAAAKTPPAMPKPKERYKVTNWREYNQALMDRGRISVYMSPELLREWGMVEKKSR
jgi:hypothetical protein